MTADSAPSPAADAIADTVAERLERAFAAHRAGQLAEAERLYRTVLALEPGQPAALANLGAALLQLGRPEAALEALDAAVAARPDHVASLGNRAGALRALGRLEAALDAARQAVARDPGYADGLNAEGLLLTELGQPEAALAPLERALGLQPGHPAIWNNHGLALARLSRPEAALASFERALALAPGFPDALSNHAAALRAAGRLEESLDACDRLLAAGPDDAEALVNRGCVLRDLGRDGEALAMFERACRVAPDHVEAHWSLALQLLAQGRWAEGWPLFEWRWRRSDLKALAGRFEAPPWLGAEPVAGKTVLLHYEQGLGDSLQMLRYADLLAEQGAEVVVAVQPPLARLAREMAGAARAITDGDPVPPYDLHAPLMSLPLALRTRPDAVPWRGPYLKPPPEVEAAWAERLGPARRRRVGLAWSGNPRHLNDRNRSLPLELLEPLLRADAEFVSLQKAYPEGDRERLAALGVQDRSDALDDLAETAGLLAQLDVVVSVDTSVAHLAGAMGKPVLILLPFAPDFRWGTRGEATPWYPSARLLRQAAPCDWSGPIARAAALIADALIADA